MSEISPAGPPAPPDPRDAAALAAWLGRLRESVAELARHQVALHRELATLTEAVDALRRGDEPAPLHVAAPPEPRQPLVHRVLHRLLALAVGAVRRLRRVEADAIVLELDRERSLVVPREPDTEGLVVDATRGAPEPWIDCALLARAAEDLAFVELRGGPHRVLVCRRELWRSGHGLVAERLEALPRGAVAGRRVLLDGRLPGADAIGGATRGVALDDPPTAGHRLPRGAPRRLRRVTAAAGPSPAARSTDTENNEENNATAILLTVPWSRRLEPVVDQAPRLLGIDDAAATTPLVVCLAPTGDAAARTAPVGDVFDERLRAAAAVALLRHHGVRRVLHVGPGDGCFDDDTLRSALDRLDVVDLPLRRFPGLEAPVNRPSTLTTSVDARAVLETVLQTVCETMRETVPTPSTQTRDTEARRRARVALGLADDAVVVAQIADLAPDERPEDVVELAHRGEASWTVVLAGRGPLAGTVTDLARWRGVDNLLVLADADPRQVLDAADVALSCAERRPLPALELEALARGVPVVATDVDDLAALAEALVPDARERLHTAPAGAVDELADALRQALTQAQQAQQAQAETAETQDA